MEFKGTPGKWFYEQDKEYPTLHNIWSESHDSIFTNGILIARTCYAPRSLANAQLIAHAPEMLEAMQSFVNGFECDYVLNNGTIVDDPYE